MRLEGVVLLAAPTPRSQAYLQAMIAAGLYPDRVIAMGDIERRHPRERGAPGVWNGILLPDLDETLMDSAMRAKLPVVHCAATDVNVDEVVSAVRDARARVVIYSGYGGQIVRSAMLGTGPQFLHMHSGWLPEYRGSTTLYYALLQGHDPAVTAFILDARIDTGPIVARRHYPRPTRALDIDRAYDAAIRADLLVRVMADYAKSGALPKCEPQDAEEGNDYYVIHPVLKHVAILALDPDGTP